MKSTFNRLGQYIEEIDIRNKLGNISNLLGVSIAKEFMSSVANVIGTDLNNYKVIEKGQFACSLMQVSRDGGIAVSLYKDDNPAIMSPAYHLFKVINDKLLPEYLEMVMISSEFDRAAVFYAVGGVRGTLTWDEFCDMRIPVPPIEEQRKIVHDYKVITDRIELLKKINENLNNELDLKFKKIINDANPPMNSIDFRNEIDVIRGVSYKPEDVSENKMIDNVCLLRANNIENLSLVFNDVIYLPLYYVKKEQYIKRNDVLISMSSGSQSAVGKVAVAHEDTNCVFGAFCGKICFVGDHPGFVTTYFKSSLFRNHLKEILLGTTINNIKQEDLTNITLNVSSIDQVNEFEREYCSFNALLCLNNAEIQRLLNLEKIIVSNLSREVS